MFGFSIMKILFTIAIVVVVWQGFKWLKRRETVEAVNAKKSLNRESASARDDVVRKVNDAALGFLLRHLPAMPVPPVDVESDNVDYFLDNLNLSQLRIDENDVTVDVASSDAGIGAYRTRRTTDVPLTDIAPPAAADDDAPAPPARSACAARMGALH